MRHSLRRLNRAMLGALGQPNLFQSSGGPLLHLLDAALVEQR